MSDRTADDMLCDLKDAVMDAATVKIAELKADLAREKERADAEHQCRLDSDARAWQGGAPPHPFDKEWIIAETVHGDRVVLTALPEEYTYDYKTADGTYIKADKIKRWMQFPDGDYHSYLRTERNDLRAALATAEPYRHVLEQRLICSNLAGLTGNADADLMRFVFHEQELALSPEVGTIAELRAQLADANARLAADTRARTAEGERDAIANTRDHAVSERDTLRLLIQAANIERDNANRDGAVLRSELNSARGQRDAACDRVVKTELERDAYKESCEKAGLAIHARRTALALAEQERDTAKIQSDVDREELRLLKEAHAQTIHKLVSDANELRARLTAAEADKASAVEALEACKNRLDQVEPVDVYENGISDDARGYKSAVEDLEVLVYAALAKGDTT